MIDSIIILAASGGAPTGIEGFLFGPARYGLVGALVVATVAFFLMLLNREKQEPLSPALQAEGKNKKWITKKASVLEKDGEYKGAGDLYDLLGDFEQAAKMYIQGRAMGKAARMFLKMKDPDRAALAFEKRGLFKKAAEHYTEAKQHEKAAAAFLKANMGLESARAYENSRNFIKAAEIYQSRGHLRKAGELFFKGGERLLAARVLEEALKHESSRLPAEMAPSESRMLSNLGFMIGSMYSQEGKFEEAAASFESGGHLAEAAAIHEQESRYNLAAQLYIKAGEPFKAAIAMEKLGQKEEAALIRAESYKQRGQLVEAVGHYEIAGRNEDAAKLYAEIKDFSKAARMYERADKHKDAAEAYLKAGEADLAAGALERAGDFTKAAEIYGQVGNLVKRAQMLSNIGDFLEAGRLYREQGQIENAIKVLQQVEEGNPKFEEAGVMLGDIFRDKGIHRIALQHYRRVLTGKKPDRANIAAFFNMATSLEASGSFGQALELYEALVLIDYHFGDVADRLKALQQRELPLTTPSTPSGMHTPMSRPGEATAVAGDATMTAPTSPGNRMRRYELVEEVGRGGMGIVYKARDTILDRIVAYKVLPANLREHPQAIKNFLREAKSAAQLNHINIVTVFDAGEEDGNYYITMEFLKGKTLKQILNKSGKMNLRQLVFYTVQVCKALSYAHARKIVHRDIKSSNIMLTDDNAVKLMDFGLAKVIEEVKGSQTIASGTPFYMSPEQTLGKNIDHRTDLYSLGVMVFEMATGTLPFMDGEAAYHHVHTTPPNPTEIAKELSPALGAIILKLMEKNPDNRFQTAKDVVDSLRGLSELFVSRDFTPAREDDSSGGD